MTTPLVILASSCHSRENLSRIAIGSGNPAFFIVILEESELSKTSRTTKNLRVGGVVNFCPH